MRPHLPADIRTAADLKELPDDSYVRTAGMVVCRQRPGTAKGFVFLLLEDETGLTNVVIRPDLYEADRLMVRGAPYLWAEGVVQNRSGSLNLLVERLGPLARVPTLLLPRPTMRHPYPGTAYDPREEAARQSGTEANGSNATERKRQPRFQNLQLATPRSHDFH